MMGTWPAGPSPTTSYLEIRQIISGHNICAVIYIMVRLTGLGKSIAQYKEHPMDKVDLLYCQSQAWLYTLGIKLDQ